MEHLREINDKVNILPEDFVFNKQIDKIYDTRHKSIANGKGIDWGGAESLAFATLLEEGFSVRVSG